MEFYMLYTALFFSNGGDNMSMSVKMSGDLNMDDLFPEITDEDIKSALRELGNIGKSAMKEAMAVDSGDAKKSVKSTIKRLDAGGYKLQIRYTKRYYGYQEFESEKSNPKNIGRVYKIVGSVDEKADEIFDKLIDKKMK